MMVVLSKAITGHSSAPLAPSEQDAKEVCVTVCSTLQAKHQGFRLIRHSLQIMQRWWWLLCRACQHMNTNGLHLALGADRHLEPVCA